MQNKQKNLKTIRIMISKFIIIFRSEQRKYSLTFHGRQVQLIDPQGSFIV